MSQRITVLRTIGGAHAPVLAKTWKSDGTIGDYDRARQFNVKRYTVDDLEGLHALLQRFQDDPRACIIRGAPRAGLDLAFAHTRNLSNFDDAPSHVFMVDVDKFEPLIYDPETNPGGAVHEFIEDMLPACFHKASYVWQLSGSHGHASKRGQLRAHLWFWLAEPLTCAEAEAWTRQYAPAADATVHRAVQVNYTARPVMGEGVVDPIAQRLGRFVALIGDGLLHVPADMPVPDVSELRNVKREDRLQLGDPGMKPGLVGAFCRAFAPEDITTLCPDSFAAGSSERRFTWLKGGGSPDGVYITSSGTHLGNSHDSSPIGNRAVNLFDFVRVHEYGALDGPEPDVYDFDITASPSYQAMVAWASGLPELQEELQSPKAEAVAEAAADAKAERAVATQESREQRLANVYAAIERADSLTALEHKIGREVAKSRAYSDAEQDCIAQALKAKSAAFTPTGKPLSIGVVRGWLQAVADEVVMGFPHLTKELTPKLTPENVQALLARLGASVRWNVITRDIELLTESRAFLRDTQANSQLTWLQGKAAECNMPNSTSQFKAMVELIASDNPFNPVAAWVDSREWDGQSRLQQLADTLVSPPGADLDLKALMLRKWLIQGVALAYSPVPITARAVLTLQGPQYAGKTRWLKSLLPGHEDLALTGRQIDPHNRDSIKPALMHWLVELGELDATFRKSDIAALKSFIANDVDMFRSAYAAKEERIQRRTSFFATVNDPEFLADATGNTRFWVIAILAVIHDHGLDMQQVWAEALHLWRSGEPHWLDAKDMERVNSFTEQFACVDPLHEQIEAAFPWDAWKEAGRPQGGWVCPSTGVAGSVARLSATQVLKQIGARAESRSDTKRAGDALRSFGAVKATRGGALGARGWLVPVAEDFASFD